MAAIALPFRPISNYLIRGTLVLAIVCMIGMFAVQTLFMVKQHSKQFEFVY